MVQTECLFEIGELEWYVTVVFSTTKSTKDTNISGRDDQVCLVVGGW